MNNVSLNPKYIPLFQSDSRYFIITGGRGSGKSFGNTVFLLSLICTEGQRILFTRYTMTSAQTSIIPEFVDKINLMGMNHLFRITKDEIINLETKSSIIFKGIRTSSGNQTAALKSLAGVNTFVLDEAEELIDEETFDKIDQSVRIKSQQNRCILILNPTTKEHWIYKRFFQNKGVPEGYNGVDGNVTYIHTTYMDNKENLSDSYLENIEDMKKNRPDKYIHQMLGGWLSSAEGTVYKNWQVGDFVETEQMCYGQDFGWSSDPTTLVRVSVDTDKRVMWVKEIYAKAGMTTNDIYVRNDLHCATDLIIADGSEPRLIEELKSKGLNIRKANRSKGTILSGISLVQDYRMIVDKSSPTIIKELNNYVWKSKNSEPIDSYNHTLDAIRYALEWLVRGRNVGKYVIR